MKKYNLLVIGSKSFIVKSFINQIDKNKFNIIEFKRPYFDLLNKNTIRKYLDSLNNYKNIVFFASANAPCKNYNDLYENIKMLDNFCYFFNQSNIEHFYYLSSDAVFSDSKKRINEKSKKQPANMHGLMHFIREKLIQARFPKKHNFLRPTLVYGYGDKHKGYGPNLFIDNLKKGKNIKLFGKGEELRDHIYKNDLGGLISSIINNDIKEDFNLVSGNEKTFLSLAKIINKSYKVDKKIIFVERQQPMPHNGLRIFDNSKIFNFFPKFKFSTIDHSIRDYISNIKK